MNNKSYKFYCIIGIITLIVIVIGATFAYFSASTSDDNSITGGTSEITKLNLDVKLVTNKTNTDLIPLNVIINQTLKDGSSEYVDSVDQFGLAMANSCVDSNGNNICSVYKITITNDNTSNNINVQGKINLDGSSTNMKWMLINGDVKKVYSEEEDTDIEVLDSSKVSRIDDFLPVTINTPGYLTYKSSLVDGNYINEISSVTLYSTSEADDVNYFNYKTFYVLVWLEETGSSQEDFDAGKTFTGIVSFEAVSGDGNTAGISASFIH